MITIACRNVNDGLAYALKALEQAGVRRKSRNGDVTYFPVPTTIFYHEPRERVLWNEKRDANPFFHFFESLWMLDGRRDVAFPARFAKKIVDYSDDTRSLNGAYGYRWRRQFGRDQIKVIAKRLRENPDDRRCVLQMWDAGSDLGSSSKDVPCNTNVFFAISPDGRLDMTVCNRSNDIVWGCFGANAVHFSFLQEYLASWIGVEVGRYWQMANNLHLYDFNRNQVSTVLPEWESDGAEEPYNAGLVAPFRLNQMGWEDMKTWDEDLSMFMEHPLSVGFRHAFFRRVALPMMAAWNSYSRKEDEDRFSKARDNLRQCLAYDWTMACDQWLGRREALARAKAESSK